MMLPRIATMTAAMAVIGLADARSVLKNLLKEPTKTPEHRKQLCIPQGEGDWTFTLNANEIDVPTFDAANPWPGLVDYRAFIIYDNNCIAHGVYSRGDGSTPFIIQDNYLPYVIIIDSVNLSIGGLYYRFEYADGRYSIGNNHCKCDDMSHGLTAEEGCKCAFPLLGEHPTTTADPPTPPPTSTSTPPPASKPSKFISLCGLGSSRCSVALGFNDMGWFYSDDVGTLESMKAIVDQARAAKPDIKFAIANVPQRTFIGGRQDLVDKTTRYNAALKDAIPQWSTESSQIEHVDFAGHYDCQPSGCPDGYDGLHPNGVGEYSIAKAFAETLHGKFGIGSGGLDDPQTYPIRNVNVPNNIKAEGVATGVAVTWDPVFGAMGYDVRQRIQGFGDWEEGRTGSNRLDTTLTVAGLTWEYQVRTSAGDHAKGEWSGTVSAVSRRDTLPPPETITVSPTGSGIDMSWSAVGGADLYEVFAWDQDTPGAWVGGYGTRGTSMSIPDLKSGSRYSLWVSTWGSLGGGLPGEARAARVGHTVPSPPSNLRVVNKDATTVQLSWDASDAASYQIFTREVHSNGEYSKDNGTEVTTSRGIAFLFPGTWNYEFCVGGINGKYSSAGTSNCVVPDKMPGY
ncbi:hypothetical protein LMH87_004042 [Akanthomyces muscarius]|uniref:Fibronectin type-III domain-containing protein n=1 Tax=Akanthomyces muscarius TaxID=2231603 RepID=A0A9W8UGP2_AKAMU|nr:hypothetical protein LMH87_004042 [Akanthomyces muscarius]KAJ4145186.1 hypothetical protein LMH87_004042 [Akanthomyces muscarius]